MNMFRLAAICHGVYARQISGISFSNRGIHDQRDAFLHTLKQGMRVIRRRDAKL